MINITARAYKEKTYKILTVFFFKLLRKYCGIVTAISFLVFVC